MKYQAILLLALCTALSACNIPDTTMANGAITLKGDAVTLHVKDAPDAVIRSDGDLNIGDKAISTSPAQHGLLMLYVQSVQDVHATGLAMGKLGAKMGITALNNKLSNKSDADQKQDAESGGQQMNKLSQKICQDQANIKSVQDQLAAQLAEFKPYGHIFSSDDVADCMKDDKD